MSGVESGQYASSVAITLRLAKALGCQIGDLARVEGQLIAYPLIGKDAFRYDMIPTDGEVVAVDGFPGITSASSFAI